jgi:hypothetical protein
MSNQSPVDHASRRVEGSTTDQILDLLLDALVERQKARRAQREPGAVPPAAAPRPEPSGADEAQSSARPPSPEKSPTPSIPPPRPEPPRSERSRPPARPTPAREMPRPKPQEASEPGDEGWEPPARLPSIHMGKTLGRLLILVVVLIVAVNVPVTRYGVSLARILPETSSLIIRDGLVLKGSRPEIYILEEDKLRWISSLDAFDHLGLTWEDVHIVEDEFLDQFEKGRPLHVLLKCQDSPHIYRLENQEKRWIRDIDTFQAEGHAWEDVRFVSCEYLREMPDGPPIPEDAGLPPQP